MTLTFILTDPITYFFGSLVQSNPRNTDIYID